MLAHASLGGLPPQAGLYRLLASLVLYAIFGASPKKVSAGARGSEIHLPPSPREVRRE